MKFGKKIGLVLGGILTEFASWRWTLLINVPIALAAAVAAQRVIKESRAEARHGYDLPGAVTATGGLFLLVYGFTMVASHGWASSLTLTLFAGAVLLLGAFVAIELRSSHPLLPMRVILERRRGGSLLTSLLVGCAMLGTFLFLTYFLQGTLHYSALKTGFAFLPFSGGIILGASAASKILPRSGPRNLMVTGLTMGTLGLLWFSRLGVHSTYAAHVLLPEIIVSVGMGLVFVPMNSTSLYGVDPADAGVASALVNTTQQVGGALGTAFLNTIAASATASYLATRIVSAPVLQTAAVHGYTTAFEISAGLVALSAVAAAIFIGPKRNHVLSGEGADPMSVVVEPVFAME